MAMSKAYNTGQGAVAREGVSKAEMNPPAEFHEAIKAGKIATVIATVLAFASKTNNTTKIVTLTNNDNGFHGFVETW